MFNVKTILSFLVAVNLISLVVFYHSTQRDLKDLNPKENLYANNDNGFLERKTPKHLNDLFASLGAYPKFKFREYSFLPSRYDRPHLGLINDENYCKRVDEYNLAHPENMFESMNFFTEYPHNTLPRTHVMSAIGTILNSNIDGHMNPKEAAKRQFHFSHQITNFFTMKGMHVNHEIGKNFLCATQMYNHIPGNGYLVRKSDILAKVSDYTEKYENNTECFDGKSYFLKSYRLFNEKECKQFFNIMNGDDYKKNLKKEPVQYLIKVGYGAHKSLGVFLLDSNKTKSLNTEYKRGEKCGEIKKPLIAQKYITNPLLLDKSNKFDFRIYMLIASTNPLIAYYHDGYLRVSVNSFNKSSSERATHLTNTYLADQVFADVKKSNTTLHGMNAEELKDYHLWNFNDLHEYLIESGKVTDEAWLDTYLRPSFQKAFVHLVRMTGMHYLKHSNVYELHGLDFMLDEDLQLWFIESNSSPLLIGVKPELITQMLKDMFEIQYGYYRSRMARVLKVVNKLKEMIENDEEVDMKSMRREYQEASKNRLEPEYGISADNTFTLVLDESKPAGEEFMGLLPKECAGI